MLGTHNLVTIAPAIGATEIIGDMQAPIQSLAWTPDGLFEAFDRLYQIGTTTAAVTAVGSTDFTDGKGVRPKLFNGIYSLAAFPVELPDEPADDDSDLAVTNIGRSGVEGVNLRWRSDATSTYSIQGSQTLTSGEWPTVVR